MAWSTFDEWGPTEQAAAGWGQEEEDLWNQALAGMEGGDRDLFNGVGPSGVQAGEKLRAQLRQRILAHTNPKKAAEAAPLYEWGGRQGQAKADADYFRQKAEDAQRRQGEVIDTTRADEWRLANQQDRLAQLEATGLMRDRAKGLVPSIADMRANLDIQRGIADQSSIQAGARGAAGLALAQQQNAQNSAALTSRISNDAQVNAAQERMDAERAWFDATSNMRGQDTASQGLDLQTAQAQAEINAQQRAQNDAYSQGMYGNEIGINTTQLQAQQNKQAHKMGQQAAGIQAQAAAQARADAEKSRVYGMIGAGVQMGLGAVGSAVSKTSATRGSDGSETWRSDDRAKQGAVQLGDAQRLAKMTPAQLKEMADKGHPLAGLVRDMRANAWDEGHRAPQAPPPDPYAGLAAQARESMAGSEAQHQGLMQRGPAVNDFTAQIADGLAPTSYEYKPGMGPSGRETGILAQRAASNPLTGSAVTQEENTGLLRLDPARSVKLSLAAAGNNAQEIQRIKQQLASFSQGGLYGGMGAGGM